MVHEVPSTSSRCRYSKKQMSRPTHFIQVCRRVEATIERATGSGRGAHRTRAAMRREFASWLTRWYAAGDYTRISRLRLPWKRWDEELKIPCLRVAAAIRLLATERKKTRAWVRKWTGVHQADLDYVLELLEAVDLSPDDIELLAGGRSTPRCSAFALGASGISPRTRMQTRGTSTSAGSRRRCVHEPRRAR
jgi:hypothetical protein